MTLYEITGQFKQLQDISLDTDEDLQAFMHLASELEGTFDHKLENYGKLISNIEADIDGFTAEIKKLTDKRKVLMNKLERIESWLEAGCKEVMQVGEKRTAGVFTFSLRKNPPKVQVLSVDLLDAEYLKSEPDIKKISDALKADKEVHGARLVQDVSLRIL